MADARVLTHDDETGLTVEHDEAATRYRVRDGDEYIGLIDYDVRGGVVVMTHTEVSPARQGGGVAGTLAGAALDDVRARGLSVDPACPYIVTYIRRHPEYADLVAS